MPPNLNADRLLDPPLDEPHPSTFAPIPSEKKIRCAILGCGMMGQEHCSYMVGFPGQLQIDFLCDPHQPSLDKCLQVLRDFRAKHNNNNNNSTYPPTTEPTLLQSEEQLLQHVHEIDLLVIATPNYLHTDSLLRWGLHYDHLTILVEKPVAVNQEQVDRLWQHQHKFQARIWVAMEYRFIPAIAKLLELLHGTTSTVGDIRMVTIRENRYPFLHKIGGWNRDAQKTGDTLVEKCCHFFDLMRLITQQEASLSQIRALAQRGINYQDETPLDESLEPIIDAAYVTLPFASPASGSASGNRNGSGSTALACLELCMYAEGSRHQEEIIVTGTRGRLEAYLPENKVYAYQRPDRTVWSDRSVPPPPVLPTIYDCTHYVRRQVVEYGDSEDEDHHPSYSNSSSTELPPTHGGYHYGSTAMEWYQLLAAVREHDATGHWRPLVSLEDGIRAVEIGLQATKAIVKDQQQQQQQHQQHQQQQQQQNLQNLQNLQSNAEVLGSKEDYHQPLATVGLDEVVTA